MSLERQPAEQSKNQMLNYLKNTAVPPFKQRLEQLGLHPLESAGISTIQVNVGNNCSLSCSHCHVDAGPDRTEIMNKYTMARCLDALAIAGIATLDITGGSPELNPDLPFFIEEASRMGKQIIVRTNLAVLEIEDYAYLANFYASNKVWLIASLPCYTEENTDRQRGPGTFKAVIRVLKRLNDLGYGLKGNRLTIDLAYNPGGPYLPPNQYALEEEFRSVLTCEYGVSFNRLYTLTNMPIGRFLDSLLNTGDFEPYLELLSNAFNSSAVEKVMCRDQISVGWDGQLYDCDFNQALGLKCTPELPGNIAGFNYESMKKRRIITGNHCYACTAGAGSSCKGICIEQKSI